MRKPSDAHGGTGDVSRQPQDRVMTEATVAVIALLVLGWAVVSGALARHDITGPFVFAVAGYVLANPDWGPLTVDVDAASVHVIAEVTLALVLFSDAARVNLAELRRDLAIPVRLLGIGLVLSVVLGSVLAGWILGGFPWALAGFVGAALAPTDAALSVQVINDERIPLRLRRALNVESGLNDGIATPIVVFMLAVAASQLGLVSHSVPARGGSGAARAGWRGRRRHRHRGRRGGADLDRRTAGLDHERRAATGHRRRRRGRIRRGAGVRRQRLHRRLRRRHRLRGAARPHGSSTSRKQPSSPSSAASSSPSSCGSCSAPPSSPSPSRTSTDEPSSTPCASLTVIRMIPVATEPRALGTRPAQRRVHRLVRPARTRLGGLRLAGHRGARRRPHPKSAEPSPRWR